MNAYERPAEKLCTSTEPEAFGFPSSTNALMTATNSWKQTFCEGSHPSVGFSSSCSSSASSSFVLHFNV